MRALVTLGVVVVVVVATVRLARLAHDAMLAAYLGRP